MSDTATEKKEDSASAAAAADVAPSSVDAVQATVTQPEVADNVNLSVKPEIDDHIAVVVAVAAVDEAVQQDNVQLTAVPTTNQPTVQNQSTVQNQPSVPNQPTVQGQPAVPSQPTVQNQPTVPSQPTLQSQPTVPTTMPNAAGTTQAVSVGTTTFKTQPDDFYRTIFYFSGMGRVIGSALAEGVYVDEKNRRKAIDPDEINLYTKASSSNSAAGPSMGGPPLITSARNQAVNLSADFRRLQTLLESLPTFTDADQGRSSVTGGGVKVDEPIHGEIYFRSERPEQYQQQQQLQQQRMRQQQQLQQQMYIMEQNPSSSFQNMNGHLINVPWNYHNSGY